LVCHKGMPRRARRLRTKLDFGLFPKMAKVELRRQQAVASKVADLWSHLIPVSPGGVLGPVNSVGCRLAMVLAARYSPQLFVSEFDVAHASHSFIAHVSHSLIGDRGLVKSNVLHFIQSIGVPAPSFFRFFIPRRWLLSGFDSSPGMAHRQLAGK